VKLLEWAKGQGDVLVVGIYSDRSAKRLKGPERPIVAQRHRALLVAALESVDFVTIFNETTPQRLIERLKPDVLVKGADWSGDRIVGRDIVEEHGGRVLRFPIVKGLSTTGLLKHLTR
jgi:D-beta-D-heptose 7-phosphate kinase/D-beta-D-heptose 1-phosphate adenosyltransferase